MKISKLLPLKLLKYFSAQNEFNFNDDIFFLSTKVKI